MKKRLVFAVSLTIVFGTLNVSAQKNKKEATKATNTTGQIAINTPNDTLSYAYGANLAQQGLLQYLDQLGITKDGEKLAQFLKGFNEGLPAKGENSAYVTGLGIGDQIYKMTTEFANQAFEDKSPDNLNIQLIAKGVSDILTNNPPMIDNTSSIVEKVMTEAGKRNEEIRKQESAAQIEAGKKFMEENKTQDGVVTLPSGLQYKIVLKGDGEIPKAGDKVKVHYKGTLLDGTEFDSSYNRGEPLTLGVDQVIAGWTEALKLMPVGSKWMLYIPYDLAYGERGTGAIPAYSNLIFEIDLLGIEK